jgi:hypothetical protein
MSEYLTLRVLVPDAVELGSVGQRTSGQPQAGLPLGGPILIEAARVMPADWLDVLTPTAAGKTHIMAAIAMSALEANLRVIVLATRTRWLKHRMIKGAQGRAVTS